MGGDLKFRRLFVRGLSCNTSDAGLRNYFEQFGVVTQAYVVNDNGISKCYGFVTFVNTRVATIVCNGSHVIDGSTVNCNLAAFPVRTSEPSSSTNTGPRMQLGGAAPPPPPVPFFPYPLPYANPYGSLNYPMSLYNVPPFHPYSHPPGSYQSATFNNPIHCPREMYVAPPVYPYGQTSLTHNTLATTSNSSQNGGQMYGPRSMAGYEIGQSSGSNGAATDNSNTYDQYGLPSEFPYEYDQRRPGRNEPSGAGYFHQVSSQNTRNAGQNDGNGRGGPMRRQRRYRR